MYGGYSGRDPHRDRAMERLSSMLHGGGEVESAVKSLRISEGLSQSSLAARSGVAQAQISRIESGMIAIPPGDARRLSVALKSDTEDLALAETLTRLSGKAKKGTLKAEETLGAVAALMESSESSEAGRALVESALSVLLNFAEKAATTRVATKAERPRRDYLGRRITKPHGGTSREAPVRDAAGRRINKPHDPRKEERNGSTE